MHAQLRSVSEESWSALGEKDMPDEPSKPSPRLEVEPTLRADSVARVREIARAFLRNQGYGDEFDALLVVSELAANAVKHGNRGPLTRSGCGSNWSDSCA